MARVLKTCLPYFLIALLFIAGTEAQKNHLLIGKSWERLESSCSQSQPLTPSVNRFEDAVRSMSRSHLPNSNEA